MRGHALMGVRNKIKNWETWDGGNLCAHLLTLLCQLTLISFPYTIAVMQSDTENAQQPLEKVKCNIGAMRPHKLLPWPIEKKRCLTHKRMFNNSLPLADALCTCLTLSSLLVIVSASVFDMAMPGLACLTLYVRITKWTKKAHRGSQRATLGHRHRRAAQGRRPRGPGEDRPHRLGAPPPPWGPGLSAEGPGRGTVRTALGHRCRLAARGEEVGGRGKGGG